MLLDKNRHKHKWLHNSALDSVECVSLTRVEPEMSVCLSAHLLHIEYWNIHSSKAFDSQLLRLRRGLVYELVWMVRVRVEVGFRSWGVYNIHESPHKHRNVRICVCFIPSLISFSSPLLPSLYWPWRWAGALFAQLHGVFSWGERRSHQTFGEMRNKI